MITRCNNPNSQHYKNYGARKIGVCKKWHTFDGFWEDMKEGYKTYLSLDRINNNGNYEKSNCRWATKTQQNRNARSNVSITYNGVTKTAVEFADEYGLLAGTLRYRIRSKWDIKKALLTPSHNKVKQ